MKGFSRSVDFDRGEFGDCHSFPGSKKRVTGPWSRTFPGAQHCLVWLSWPNPLFTFCQEDPRRFYQLLGVPWSKSHALSDLFNSGLPEGSGQWRADPFSCNRRVLSSASAMCQTAGTALCAQMESPHPCMKSSVITERLSLT